MEAPELGNSATAEIGACARGGIRRELAGKRPRFAALGGGSDPLRRSTAPLMLLNIYNEEVCKLKGLKPRCGPEIDTKSIKPHCGTSVI